MESLLSLLDRAASAMGLELRDLGFVLAGMSLTLQGLVLGDIAYHGPTTWVLWPIMVATLAALLALAMVHRRR